VTSARPLALAALVFAVGAGTAGAQRPDSLRAPVRHRSIAEDLLMFSQVLNQIRVNHPDSLDPHDLLMAAIQGMVQAADPHSFVIPAERLDAAKQKAYDEGKLVPVPISFSYVEGAPLVASVASGSRAVSLDILPGDELVAADGHPIAAQSPDELDLALAGAPGSSVTLQFLRRRLDGSLARLDRTVRRERVDEASAVPVAMMLDSATGYIRVTTFEGDKVADDLHDALGKLEDAGMKGLVLDLRDNGGGRVDQAARIAGEFLPRGDIVYTATGRKASVTDTVRVGRAFWKSERKYPVVLLVNRGTASASELVAGALQDHDRALIVGRPTFGKSLIMNTFPLTDGSIMVLVVGWLNTPCGRVIQRRYRGTSRYEYFEEAGVASDTAGRPSCHTDHGRTVYGGGGIFPDVMLPLTAAPPDWLERLNEAGTVLTWANGYVSATGASLPGVDSLAASPTLPAGALAQFRAYARQAGVSVPADSVSDRWLQRALVGEVAFVKYGTRGFYRMAARLDPAVRTAAEEMGKARALMTGGKP
jgi:carboxyl-terminal processing protease